MPMLRLETEADVAAWVDSLGLTAAEWVASEYVDARSGDGYYRKYRYVMAGAHGVCRHLLVSPHWEVRPKHRLLTDSTIADELAFVNGPCAQHEIFNAARRALEFDIAAFDYSFDVGGELVVWEVNPYPDLSTPRGRPSEYLGDTVRRTNQLLADFYRDELVAAVARNPGP